jgi:SAM-dependent methyltransferase
MYTDIQKFFDNKKQPVGKCLLIGDTLKGGKGNSALTDMLPKGCEITAPDYPGVDIHDMPYGDNTFDYAMSDQVLEHVRKPWIGVEEVRRVLKPGGIAVLTSALIFYMHGVPHDYWRFTPDGLKVLCENFSRIHRCAGTGDLNFVLDVLQGRGGSKIVPGSPLEKRALACDGKNIVSVWIIAEK